MKTTTKLLQMTGTAILIFALAFSVSAASTNSLEDIPYKDIHAQIHDLLTDFDFALIPHHGTKTVVGTISIDRTGRILVKENLDPTEKLEAHVFRLLDQKILYNIDEYRGKKVILRITLKRRN